MTKRTNPPAIDEKGNPIVSGVLYETRCEWCDCPVPVRGAGRRPKFCSPAHRLAMHRAVENYRRALDDARRAQAEADAKVEQARWLIERGAGDFATGLDAPGREKRLRAIRFAPASNETRSTTSNRFEPASNERSSTTTTDADGITEAAWVYVKGSGWVDPATIEA